MISFLCVKQLSLQKSALQFRTVYNATFFPKEETFCPCFCSLLEKHILSNFRAISTKMIKLSNYLIFFNPNTLYHVSNRPFYLSALEPEAKQPVQRTPPIHPPHLRPWKQASKRVTCRTIHQTRGLHSTNSKPIKETYLWTGLLKWTHEAHTVTRGFSRVTSRDMQMYSWRHVVRVVMWCSRQRFQLRKARRLRRSHQMKRLDWHRGLCIYYEQPAVVFFSYI